MSADDLIASINQARDKLQGARELIKSVEVPPGKKLTVSDRRAVWRQLVNKPSVIPEFMHPVIQQYNYRGYRERSNITGKMETWQLSHEDLARRENGGEVVPRSRLDHARVDPFAYQFLSEDEKNVVDSFSTDPDAVARHNSLPPAERARIEALRDYNREEFWTRPGHSEYDPRTWQTPPTAPATNSLPESPTARATNIADNTISSGGALRGVSRVLGPAGSLFGGAYSLYEAYEADGGFGENFSETAGGIAGGAAGGWGGAAAGAALGTVLIPIPGVGTVVGGIAGGIAGGIGGEKIGEFLGGLF
jgi:hypothetical protein